MSTLDSSGSEESISPPTKSFGSLESIARLDRSDDSLTLLFQRRRYETEENPIGPRTPRQRRVVNDEETQDIIDCVTRLNAKIRKIQMKKQIRKSKKSKKSSKSRSLSRSTKRRLQEKQKKKKKTEEDMKMVDSEKSEKTDDDDTDTSVMPARVRLIKPEPCDHRGVPLSHPMAITPYPGASTAAERAKARETLKKLAIRMHEKDMAKLREEKEKSLKTAKSKGSKSSKSSKSIKTAKSSKSTSSKKAKSSKASKSSSKKYKKTTRCTSCGSCLKCAKKCIDHHPQITNEERKEFFQSIKALRKKLVKPESSREKPASSPYDVTQSSSEATIRKKSEEKKKKKKKKKQEEE